jgi:hypothetical protein
MTGQMHSKGLTHKTPGFSTHEGQGEPYATQDAVAYHGYSDSIPAGSRRGLRAEHAWS